MITAYIPLKDGRQIKVEKPKGCNQSFFLITSEGEEQLLSIDDSKYNYIIFTNTVTQEQFGLYISGMY